MRMLRIAWMGLLILAAAGCAVTQQTRQSLSAYTQAMAQVEQSADMFLTDFSSGLKAQAELKRLDGAPAPPAPDYPATLRLPEDGSLSGSPAEQRVQQTRQALAVVHAYNDALVALAEGRPESEIRQDLLGLGGDLQTLATVAGATFPEFVPFAAIGAKIFHLAQNAANRKQLEQAVLEGREPVHVILQVFADQAPAMYELSAIGARQAQVKLQNDMRRVAAAMKGLVARSGPPVDVGMASRVASDQATLGEIGRKTGTLGAMPIPYAFTRGSPAYNAAADAQLQVFIQSLSMSAQKNDELIAKQNAYHDLMVQYVALLKRTDKSMSQLADSLTEPVDLRAELFMLLRTAFDLRDATAAFRNAQQTPRS